MEEIAHQLEMGAEGLAENDKFLLDCNLTSWQQRMANSRSTGFLPFRRQGRCAASAPQHRTHHSAVGAEPRKGKGKTRLQFTMHMLGTT